MNLIVSYLQWLLLIVKSTEIHCTHRECEFQFGMSVLLNVSKLRGAAISGCWKVLAIQREHMKYLRKMQLQSSHIKVGSCDITRHHQLKFQLVRVADYTSILHVLEATSWPVALFGYRHWRALQNHGYVLIRIRDEISRFTNDFFSRGTRAKGHGTGRTDGQTDTSFYALKRHRLRSA